MSCNGFVVISNVGCKSRLHVLGLSDRQNKNKDFLFFSGKYLLDLTEFNLTEYVSNLMKF